MDFRHLLEQAKSLEKNLRDMEDRLASHEVTASAGGEAVSVRMNGAGDVLALNIDAELIGTNDPGLIQETVMAALNQAVAATRRYREEQRAELTGGLKLPEF